MTDFELPAATPLVLLPVRLETRFAGTTLRIRVYPDQCHVDTHEPELTSEEIRAGRRFWTSSWPPAEEAERDAWDSLAARYGAERGAWIARALRPLNLDRRPVEKPRFPSPATRTSAWTRAPLAQGLPDRWFARAIAIGHPNLPVIAHGAPIMRPVPIGPAPGAPAPAGELPFDEDSAWLADFDKAVDRGMAFILDRPPSIPEDEFRGYARLFVYGVRDRVDGVAGARTLAALLDAHYYTHGLSFLPQGTATNNLPGAATAPARGEPAYRDAYLPRPRTAPLAPDSNASVLTTALGLATGGALTMAPGAENAEQPIAAWMQTALWQPTWGYFLTRLLGEDGVHADRVRRHLLQWARPAGPLPTLRIGAQPYGILPVLPTSAFADLEHGDLGMTAVGFLQRLRTEIWEPSIAAVPRATDPQGPETGLRILGMGAHAQRYYARSVLGMDYVAYLWRFAEPEIGLGADWRTELTAAAGRLGQRLGLGAWDPRIGRSVFATDSFPVPGLPVEHPQGTHAHDYLLELAAEGLSATAVRDRQDTGAVETTPLLYRLLRHALMLEHAEAAARIRARHGLPPAPPEPEVIDIVPGEVTATVWRQLAEAREWAAGRPVETLGGYIAAGPATDPDLAALAEFRTALRALAEVPAPILARVMAQSLDLASHRLDAWLTSFATRRLRWLRAGHGAEGVHVGAYGWVENLTPRPAPAVAAPSADEPGPLWRDPGSAGHIHAPSLAHAATAAVLRGGYRAYGAGGPLAVDLRSHRIRTARWLLDGIRQGQPLGALLGYRVERDLREHRRVGLPAYLPALRARFPRRASALSVSGVAPTTRTYTVVDGLALHRAWTGGTLDLARDLGVTDPDDRAALIQVLGDLAEVIDAVSDALLAEGVHHIVQGNPLRAGATLDAADRGEALPPELEVARTPRTGIAVTHRLLIVLDDPGDGAAAWPADPITQARAQAAPRLNTWLAGLLPAPSRVRYRAEATDLQGVAAWREYTLATLGMSPLDLIALPERDPAAARTELDLRLMAAVRQRPGIDPQTGVTLELTRDPGWTPDVVSVAELLEVLRGLRALLALVRPLEPADLVLPGARVAAPAEDPALAAQADDAAAALQAAADDLTSADEALLRRGLLRAAHLGISEAYPDGPATRAQADLILNVLTRRKTRLNELAAAFAAGGSTAVTYHRERLRAIFGDGFLVLTAFSPPGDAFETALTGSTDAQGGDPLAASGWLHRVARVRRGVDRLLAASSYAQALNTGHSAAVRVAQLPHTPGERWLGLPLDGDRLGSRLSLLVQAPDPLPGTLCGLVVDEWTEVIPASSETTGVAFHFDAPGACAPQAVLLAVSPDDRARWSTGLIEDTLAEALSLARLRAVDLEALVPVDPGAMTDIGQLLPAIHLATNQQHNDAIATDLTRGGG